MSEFTKVHCRIPNGIVLRLFEQVEGPFGTTSYLPSEQWTLNAGDNEVPSEFFDKWLEVNSDSDFIKGNFIQQEKH
jgi:hypothetical protein